MAHLQARYDYFPKTLKSTFSTQQVPHYLEDTNAFWEEAYPLQSGEYCDETISHSHSYQLDTQDHKTLPDTFSSKCQVKIQPTFQAHHAQHLYHHCHHEQHGV